MLYPIRQLSLWRMRMMSPDLSRIGQQTWRWKLALGYDALMMLLIFCNVLTLGTQLIIESVFGAWIAGLLGLSSERQVFFTDIAPVIRLIDIYFISYLIVELIVRWICAIALRQHERWWFFPFVHWYEVLAIIPFLRFLRLLRAFSIGYRLHQLGYSVVPIKLIKHGQFYYDVVMEEITDRIILTAIKQVEKELEDSTVLHGILNGIVEHHRQQFAVALADSLQRTVPTLLDKHHALLADYIGQAVGQSLLKNPEIHTLLKAIPFVGGKIEQRTQIISQQLGQQLTQELLNPLKQSPKTHEVANPIFQQIAHDLSQIDIDTPYIETLTDSLMRETLEAMRQQVKIQQWKIAMQKTKTVTPE